MATPETGTLWTIRYHLIDEATGVAGSGRDDLDRDDPPRDDPGRHRGRRPSRRPALRARSSGAGCASRSSSATCRSSPTRWSTRRSGRARSRSRRPTTTTTTRPACGTACPRSRSSPTTRRSPGPGPPTTGSTGTRRGERIVADLDAMGDLVGSAAARDGRRPLPAQLGHRRAAPQDPVVHPDGPAGGPRPRRHAVRPDADPAGPVREDLGALADHDPRLEREPPAVVGPPHPGLVLPGRARDRLVARGRAGCLRGLRPAGGRAHAGPGHLRHLVQLRPVAVLDPRLARRHARLPAVLPDVGDGDRLRHHLLLGRPDDDAGPPPHRPRALPHRLPLGPHPRPRGPEDVEDEGQRRRPARGHRFQRRRRAPVRASSTAPRPGRTSG